MVLKCLSDDLNWLSASLYIPNLHTQREREGVCVFVWGEGVCLCVRLGGLTIVKPPEIDPPRKGHFSMKDTLFCPTLYISITEKGHTSGKRTLSMSVSFPVWTWSY